MYRASFQASLDDPWRFMEPICVGPVPSRHPEPNYVTVERDGVPFTRIDAFANYQGPFSKVIGWERFVAVGLDETVHLVDPATRETRTIECDGYFGDLVPREGRLFVTSASELICVGASGDTLWRCKGLAIDGVIVDRIEDGVIIGRGEWDPPGGWQTFRVSLDNGVLLEGGDPQRANPPMQRTGAAGMVSGVRKWFGRGPGR